MKSNVVTVEAMARADLKTLKDENITELALIKRVGRRLFETLLKEEKAMTLRRVLILVGPGNNGADGLALYQELKHAGYSVSVYCFLPSHANAHVNTLKTSVEHDDICHEVKDFNVYSHIIDGVFGTGFNKALPNDVRMIFEDVNKSKAKKISLDIASGLSGESGLKDKGAFSADVTYVVQALKVGNILHQGLDCSRAFVVVDVGIKLDQATMLYSKARKAWLKEESRKHFTHKYDYGRVVVFGGSQGMMGAPYLTALAAYKSGAGHVLVMHRQEDFSYAPRHFLEVLSGAYDQIDLWEEKASVVFGVGIALKHERHAKDLACILKSKAKVVVDATGIKHSMACKKLLHKDVLITPHLGEFAAFMGVSVETMKENTMAYVEAFTKEHEATLLLKGPVTVLANKKEVLFLESGNPALAKAGSGDVLSGLCARYLARGKSCFDAGKLGVTLLGLAADKGKERFGEEALMASDVIACLHEVMR